MYRRSHHHNRSWGIKVLFKRKYGSRITEYRCDFSTMVVDSKEFAVNILKISRIARTGAASIIIVR
jgi:hypothetical protein